MTISEIGKGLSIFVDTLKSIDKIGPRALSEYVKPATVIGSVVLDRTLVDEPIIMNMASMLNSFYIGYITTALQLNTVIESGGTVRDMLHLVSSKDFVDIVDVANVDFLSDRKVTSVRVDLHASHQGGGGSSEEPSLFSGKVITLNLNTSKEKNISITLYVQLIARNVDATVIEQGFAASNKQTIDQRWNMMKAGEISFWKDFIFERDLVKKHRNALQKDNTGYLYDELSARSNKLAENISLGTSGKPMSQNSANNIIILEARAFRGMIKRTGISYDDFISRQGFLSNNYCLMLCVVDTMYNTVRVNFNGIRTSAEYNFKAIAANYGRKSNDQAELKDIMTQFAVGSTPKVF